MIDIGNLWWIVPTSAVFGFLVALWLSTDDGQNGNDEPDVCKHCMCVHCPYNPSLTYDENS